VIYTLACTKLAAIEEEKWKLTAKEKRSKDKSEMNLFFVAPLILIDDSMLLPDLLLLHNFIVVAKKLMLLNSLVFKRTHTHMCNFPLFSWCALNFLPFVRFIRTSLCNEKRFLSQGIFFARKINWKKSFLYPTKYVKSSWN
jgi:hypothetical protein